MFASFSHAHWSREYNETKFGFFGGLHVRQPFCIHCRIMWVKRRKRSFSCHRFCWKRARQLILKNGFQVGWLLLVWASFPLPFCENINGNLSLLWLDKEAVEKSSLVSIFLNQNNIRWHLRIDPAQSPQTLNYSFYQSGARFIMFDSLSVCSCKNEATYTG